MPPHEQISFKIVVVIFVIFVIFRQLCNFCQCNFVRVGHNYPCIGINRTLVYHQYPPTMCGVDVSGLLRCEDRAVERAGIRGNFPEALTLLGGPFLPTFINFFITLKHLLYFFAFKPDYSIENCDCIF